MSKNDVCRQYEYWIMEKPSNTASLFVSRRRFQVKFLLLAAAALHVSLTLAVFMIGKYQLLPSQISPNGIGKFALDGTLYQEQVVELSNIIKSQGVRAWATWSSQLHVR